MIILQGFHSIEKLGFKTQLSKQAKCLSYTYMFSMNQKSWGIVENNSFQSWIQFVDFLC